MTRADRAEFESWFAAAWPGSELLLPGIHAFAETLIAGAKRMSLISKGDQSRVYMRHFRECAEPAFLMRFPEGASVLDVGSGNGLPGVLAALLRPDLNVTLLEPRLRRVAFLERSLLLSRCGNAEVLEGTLESAARSSRQWEHSLSRALRFTPRMVEALIRVSPVGSEHLRFGAPGKAPEDIPLSPARAIQVWPRSRWADLAQDA